MAAVEKGKVMTPEEFEHEWDASYYDPERDCPRCKGSGRVATDDYESYFGANYKPCPECQGDPCTGEPPLS